VAFLTRLPVAGTAQRSAGAAAFGVVGALIGLLGAALLVAVGGRAPLAAAGLALGAMAGLSGGLHLDGLADTFDALAARTPEAANTARRDPRVGSAGAAALTIAILVQASLLAALIETAGPALAGVGCVVAAAGSRVGPVLVSALARAPNGTGVGAWFAARTSAAAAVVAVASAAAIATGAAVIAGRPGLLTATLVGMGIALGGSGWLIRARGGLDGDAFGTIVEFEFLATLLVLVFTL
jgi:adenosylcobinamide-GDP ribazoletransferase